MNQAVEHKNSKIESLLTSKKKTKDKKSKPKDLGHVRIIDDDAPIPWGTAIESEAIVDEEIVSFEDAPIVVGIVDERPPDIREKERFNNPKRWRTGAFEEVPEPIAIVVQAKTTKTSSSVNSHKKQRLSDDSDPDIERRETNNRDNRDLSPPRRTKHQNDSDSSRSRRRRPYDDDLSPPRQRDLSPPRKNREDSSPSRRNQQDNDLSPPRRRDTHSPRRKRDDSSLSRKRNISDHDHSSPRRRDQSPLRKKREDSSPPRRRRQVDDDCSPPRRKYDDSSSVQPKSKHNEDSKPRDKSSPTHRRNDRHTRQESSPSSTQRRQPKEETSSLVHRRPKQESSSPPPPPPSFQPAKSERRRLTEHKEQIAERYQQWGRGLAQVRQTEDNIKDYLELAAKPLARYRDDTDLDIMLKQREREDDPMLKYLSNKTSDTGDRTSNSNNAPVKPRYKGPDPQKNRFDIWPGYRWDGVDRSNGYEKKLFESIANRHAKSQEAYLWSVEDM